MSFMCSQKDFDLCLKNISHGKRPFMIERKRGRKAVIQGGKTLLYCGNKFTLKIENGKRVITLFGNVKKGFNKFIVKNKLVVKSVRPIHNSYYRNYQLFKNLQPNSLFYIIDVNHCFWRIAYLRGYISKRVYENTLKEKDMKLFRNMALSCTIAPKIREYWSGDQKLMEISEDTTLYQIMYRNIRYSAYNAIGDVCEAIGRDNCLGYRTDGIFVLPEHRDAVKSLMRKFRLTCKTIKCRKVDDLHYFQEDESKVKRF